MRTREPLLLVAAFLVAACSAANGGEGISAPVPTSRASEDPRLGTTGPMTFVHGESSNQDLRLEISAVDGMYPSGYPIEVYATVEALGSAAGVSATDGPAASAAAIAFFGSSHPVGFGVEEVGGKRAVEPVFSADCAPTVFDVGVPRGFPFVKSGGTSGGPNDAFVEEYLNITDDMPDPELRLPAGNWRIYATTQLEPDGCSAGAQPLEASVTIVVSGPDPSPWPNGPQPSPAPGSSPTPASSPTQPPAGDSLPTPMASRRSA